MRILALDLGKFNTMCCFFDSETRKRTFLNAAIERNYLETVFKKHKIDPVVMEACGTSNWNNGIDFRSGIKKIIQDSVCAINMSYLPSILPVKL